MQIFYSNIKTQGDQAVSPRERREMRNAIIDYGALQPSPVLGPEADESNEVKPPDGEGTEEEELDLGFGHFEVIPPADFDLFDTHFEIDSEMHASFADATQEFWESFPGAMEM
jgi:hypothetical protein